MNVTDKPVIVRVMEQAHGQSFRDILVETYRDKGKQKEVAKALGLSVRTLQRLEDQIGAARRLPDGTMLGRD